MNYTIFDGLALSDLHFEPDHPIKKFPPFLKTGESLPKIQQFSFVTMPYSL